MKFNLPNEEPQVGSEIHIAIAGTLLNLVAIQEAFLSGEYSKEEIDEAFNIIKKRIKKGYP